MSHGLISGSDARFYLYAKTIVSSRRWTGEACSCVFFNTQKARTNFFIENRGGSFRTKAAINDGFVTENSGMSFYELLGISESGTFSEIKQAYKQLARKYHPDVSPPDRIDEYTRRFIQIQEAYEVLSDPSSRALYDRDLAMGLHLAFSSRKRYQYDEGLEERGEWRNRWQSQLSELKKRSMYKNSRGNMSWAARMRRQKNESSAEKAENVNVDGLEQIPLAMEYLSVKERCLALVQSQYTEELRISNTAELSACYTSLEANVVQQIGVLSKHLNLHPVRF